jgi:hypothetical protein
MIGEQVVGAEGIAASSKPVVEESFEPGVEWDVPVTVQLADRHARPVGRANLNHGIDGQVDELAAAQASASQHRHTQADKRIGVCPCRAEQLG